MESGQRGQTTRAHSCDGLTMLATGFWGHRSPEHWRVQPLRRRSKIAADLAAALLAIPPLRDNSAFRHPQAAHAAPTSAQGARRAGGWLTPAGSPPVARAGQWCRATQALQRSASLLRSRASAAACAVACAAVKQERVRQNLKDSDLEDGA